MFELISVTRDELEICESFYPSKKEAIDAMVEDIIISTSYESIDEIVDAADRGECGFSDDDAWAETNQFGTGQWKIVEVPKKSIKASKPDDVKCEEFTCDENLSQFTTSMLFDHQNIAYGKFCYGDKTLEIDLDVCGEVSVRYNGETYHSPSEFPDELLKLIKEHPHDWDVYAPSGEGTDDEESNIYVGLNNWFEYLFDGDGEVYEDDLSKATPDSIKRDMFEIARQYFKVDAA